MLLTNPYQFTQDFQFHKDLMTQLVEQTQAKRILELGSDVGDSTRIFASALAYFGGNLWTIDINPPKWNQEWMDGLYNFTAITEDTLNPELKWDKEVDILFIDDDHTYPHVLEELKKFGPWVRRGGYILLHDTQHSQYGTQVTQSINEWTRQVKLKWEDHPEGHGMGVISVDKSLRH